ncbi:hypothetical protein [Rhabdaerophilum sp. SD176]|uniref:hypothetical protein n=1 Tax=Rhabdaerophilum sp. SD176 TaxID=2983548 RepID=UPI0024DF37B1|nr:hypothetical protein [Rhabdaerophilum sp. SD176]
MTLTTFFLGFLTRERRRFRETAQEAQRAFDAGPDLFQMNFVALHSQFASKGQATGLMKIRQGRRPPA